MLGDRLRKVTVRVLRVFHGGRDPGHRARERALVAAGLDLTFVVPAGWPAAGSEDALPAEPFEIVELPVRRGGDVNRHAYDDTQIATVLRDRQPDLVDLQIEPFSVACRQWLRAVGDRPTVAYTAQNVDKRYPPPFAQYERAAYGKLSGLYPCSRQAASVARGKGFDGLIEALPLGVDTSQISAGSQRADDPELLLGLVGRLVPHKGVLDSVELLHRVRAVRSARLVIAGSGQEEAPARALVHQLRLQDAVDFLPWQSPADLAQLYRRLHVVLIPSTATRTWVEQFGRVIVEGQAAGALVAGYASGSIPEVAGPAAVLAPEHDVTALADGVLAAVADPADFERRRQAGLASAAEVRWDVIARRQIAFYEQAIGRRPVPASTRPGVERRAEAVAEFGPPATLAGGAPRPFALPVLRRDAAWTRALGSALDALSRFRPTLRR